MTHNVITLLITLDFAIRHLCTCIFVTKKRIIPSIHQNTVSDISAAEKFHALSKDNGIAQDKPICQIYQIGQI